MPDQTPMNDQFVKEWRETVEGFLSRHPEYKAGAPLHTAFDHMVKCVASLPGAEHMTAWEILQMAYVRLTITADTVKGRAQRRADLEATVIKHYWRPE